MAYLAMGHDRNRHRQDDFLRRCGPDRAQPSLPCRGVAIGTDITGSFMTDPSAMPPPVAPAGEFASWLPRLAAYLIDMAPIIALTVVLTALFGDNSAGDGSVSFSLSGFPALIQFIASLGWFVYNWMLGQGRTGQTLGKKTMKMGVFAAGTRTPIGPGLTFVRQLAHVLDFIPCLIGYLWPLWDKEKRTFADMIMSTRLYKV